MFLRRTGVISFERGYTVLLFALMTRISASSGYFSFPPSLSESPSHPERSSFRPRYPEVIVLVSTPEGRAIISAEPKVQSKVIDRVLEGTKVALALAEFGLTFGPQIIEMISRVAEFGTKNALSETRKIVKYDLPNRT